MEFHEIANKFPMMGVDEFDQLKADIKANGLLEPIWLYEGKILDGRNRWLACGEVGEKPCFNYYQEDQPIAFVISKNLHRRHLNKSQSAMIATEFKPLLEEEAKKRQGIRNDIVELIPPSEQGKARDKAGKLFNVSGRYVSEAEKIKQEAPQYVEPILNGEMTITQAKREILMASKKESPPLPTNKYRIVYADPPWSYGNSGIIGDDNYGHVNRHYPSMTINELCELPIKELVDDNAVLFLWVTSPILQECFDVIRAWGFRYKTSFVWDKVKHNFGHYNSVRHEFLLICTRGSCTPDNVKLFDSVQSIEKSDIHSEKPEAFREMIEALYTYGNKLELFARKQVEGWEAWGNEPNIG